MKFVFLFICWMTRLSISKESPIEGSTLLPEPIVVVHPHGIHILNDDDDSKQGGEPSGTKEDMDQSVNRSNYSRQLALTTTLGYDEWWFATTRRPRISLKDFPGRPGVATWKEISPNSPADTRNSRKMDPTAEGVSSNSRSLRLNYNFSQTLLSSLLMIFFICGFCWT